MILVILTDLKWETFSLISDGEKKRLLFYALYSGFNNICGIKQENGFSKVLAQNRSLSKSASAY